MAQNRSSAVMQQRSEKMASLDYFPTPPWATRALCEWLKANYVQTNALSVWEPACGGGYMARPLEEYFASVKATDIFDYGYGTGGIDFVGITSAQDEPVDWIITNPPFTLAEQFAERAIRIARQGVAFILRTSFLEGKGRYERLFKPHPPTDVLQFAERVPMVRGKVDKDATSATSYSWIVWKGVKHPAQGTRFHWIAPCRDSLERGSDYEALNV